MLNQKRATPVDESTMQILRSLCRPEPIDSIETNVKQALAKQNGQDLASTPLTKQDDDEEMTLDECIETIERQTATLEAGIKRRDELELCSAKFKKCSDELKNQVEKDEKSITSHKRFVWF